MSKKTTIKKSNNGLNQIPGGSRITILGDRTHIHASYAAGTHTIKADEVHVWTNGEENDGEEGGSSRPTITYTRPKTTVLTKSGDTLVGWISDCDYYYGRENVVSLCTQDGNTHQLLFERVTTEPYRTYTIKSKKPFALELIFHRGLCIKVDAQATMLPDESKIIMNQQVTITNKFPFPINNIQSLCISFQNSDRFSDNENYGKVTSSKNSAQQQQQNESKEEIGNAQKMASITATSPGLMQDLERQALLLCTLGAVPNLDAGAPHIMPLPSVTLNITDTFTNYDTYAGWLTTSYQVSADRNVYPCTLWFTNEFKDTIGSIRIPMTAANTLFEVTLSERCGCYNNAPDTNIIVVSSGNEKDGKKSVTLQSTLDIPRKVRIVNDDEKQKPVVLPAGKEKIFTWEVRNEHRRY